MPESTARVIPINEEIRGEIISFPNRETKTTPVAKRATINIPKRAEYIRSLDDIRAIQNYYLSNGRYRDNMMLVVGICTGLRISDIVALNISDIFNEDWTYKESIDIYEKKTGKRTQNLDDKCKITEAMRVAIDEYLKHHKVKDFDEALLYSVKRDGNGEHRLRPESGWRIVKQAQRALNLPYNLGSHSMRKTFANIAACCGAEFNIDLHRLAQIQHMLRHSDYATTMRYLGLSSIFTERARDDVSDFLMGKTSYNDLTVALMGDNRTEKETSKLDKILELLEALIDADE